MRDEAMPMAQQWNVGSRTRWLAVIAMGSTLCALSPNAAKAQCVELTDRVPPIALKTFTAEPSSLLRELRNDKEKLAGRLAGYLVTDTSLLPAVRTLVSEAPTADRSAIGAGLRRAETRCLISKPEAARKINNFVRKLEDDAVLSGYMAEAAADEPAPPPPVGKSASSNDGLLTGEWKTEIANPFESVPLPQ
jgi:hypothetical protein